MSEAVERRQGELRLEILDALCLAVDQPERVLEIAMRTTGSDEDVVDALAESFGMSLDGAHAVLEMQVLRFSPTRIQQLRDERDELAARIRDFEEN